MRDLEEELTLSSFEIWGEIKLLGAVLYVIEFDFHNFLWRVDSEAFDST